MSTNDELKTVVYRLSNSDKEKIEGTKFYFTSKHGEIITVNDTGGDITPIIEALSEPLYQLMEEQEDVSDF